MIFDHRALQIYDSYDNEIANKKTPSIIQQIDSWSGEEKKNAMQA